MSIQERQNQPDSLAKLAAQRSLYQRVKSSRIISLLLTSAVALLGLAASLLDDQHLARFVPLVVIMMWALDQEVLKRTQGALKTEAATIQEDFDCFVLDLPWPAHKLMRRPTFDRIKQLAGPGGGKPTTTNDLKNWYNPTAIPNHPILAKLHCQRMNCWWDLTLRREWIKFLNVSLAIIVFTLLSLAVATGITVAKFVAMGASMIRVIAWVRDECNGQTETIRRIDGLYQYMSDLPEKESISPGVFRSIQDEIFEYRRSNPPVPDWFYRLKQNDQESDAGTPYDRSTL